MTALAAVSPRPLLSRYFARLQQRQPWRWRGQVLESVGQTIESSGPLASVGECCEIQDQFGHPHLAEVIGFRGSNVLSMPVETTEGIRFGDPVAALGVHPEIEVGAALMGRVLDAAGKPIDQGRPPAGLHAMPLDGVVRSPLDRVPIRTALGTGIRVLDALLTVGRGQRVGIFGGSGVGKSTLIGMMTRGTAADMTVLALVGERGREVGDFLEVLGEEGLKRAVVIVSTSDQSPLLRIRAALSATAVAEYFASLGKNVLLIVDSLTRFAMAQREIGLAAGEPPTAKGYTPSVLNMLARLVERAGNFSQGSITAFYTVLMEGDDQQDPVVDTVRSLLDGHVVLDRNLAMRSHYPPISVLQSLSRLMSSVVSRAHLDKANSLRMSMAAYARSEDLIRIGAYQKGSDPALDKAVEILPALNVFLQQRPETRCKYSETADALQALPS